MKKHILTATATVAFLSISLVGVASADWELSIHGNGSRSDNSIDVDVDKSVVVSQSNNTRIDNNVNVRNVTGLNSASGNTGGDVSINTGDAEANVDIMNVAGQNIANIGLCGGCDEDFKLDISGNGSWSDNSISFDLNKSVVVDQDNDTDIDNDVNVENVTGNNSASGGNGNHSLYEEKKDFPKYDNKNYDNRDDGKKDNYNRYPWLKNDQGKNDYDKKEYRNSGKYDKNGYTREGKYGRSMEDFEHNDKYFKFLDYDRGDDEYRKSNDHDDRYDWRWRYDGGNTGGSNVTIDTGDAEANVSLHNVASSNQVSL